MNRRLRTEPDIVNVDTGTEGKGTEMSTETEVQRVKIYGVGPKYARLLREAGVDQIGKLVKPGQTARDLADRLAEANERAQIVQRLPSEHTVHGWMEAGRTATATGKATRNSQLVGRATGRLPGPPIVPPPKPRPK
jgi:hypothetical protein